MIRKINLQEDFHPSVPKWVRSRSSKGYHGKADGGRIFNRVTDPANMVWTELDVDADSVAKLKSSDTDGVIYLARGYDDRGYEFTTSNTEDRMVDVNGRNSRISRCSVKWLLSHVDEIGMLETKASDRFGKQRERSAVQADDPVKQAQQYKQHQISDREWDRITGRYVDTKKWVTGDRSRSYYRGGDSNYDKSGYRHPDLRVKYADKLGQMGLAKYTKSVDKLLQAYEDLTRCYRKIRRGLDGGTYTYSDQRQAYDSLMRRVTNILDRIEKISPEDVQNSAETANSLFRDVKSVPSLVKEVYEFIDSVNNPQE